MAQFNERVVLQTIRLRGPLAQADIARITKLTPQAVSHILTRLELEGLVWRMEPVRGRVGQPSVPIALNPDGAFSIGIKLGRQSLDTLLVDFAGHVRQRLSFSYTFPDPDLVFPQMGEMVGRLRHSLPPSLRERVHGVGVAAPLSLGGWHELLGVDRDLAGKWDAIDIAACAKSLPAVGDLPVEFVKDTAAACVAELVAGRGRSTHSFLYVFVDTFVGGGLVLDGQLRAGHSANAGAVGSLPLCLGRDPNQPPAQLLSTASLWNLDARYSKAGLERGAWIDERALRSPWLQHTKVWLEEAAAGIALAINSAACLLDLEGVIIDGSIDRALLDLLMASVEDALTHYSWQGVGRPALMPGTIGSDARAIGGALLPLYANFAPDRNAFLKIGQ